MKIWDLPTRIYHWLQALIFTVLAFSGFEIFGTEQLHERLGTLLTILIFWRIGWGVIGSETSRFTNFFPNVNSVLAYIKGNAKQNVGHNPLGALMVLFMLVLLLFQAISGLILSELIDGKAIFERQTLKTLKSLHEINAWALVVCSCFHVSVILVYKLNGKPLIMTMITGSTDKALDNQLIFVRKRIAFTLLMITVLALLFTIKSLN